MRDDSLGVGPGLPEHVVAPDGADRSAASGAWRGAVAGVLATLPMTVLLLAGQRAGLTGRLPPSKITSKVLRAAGSRREKPPGHSLATAVAHFGFGAGAGAILGALYRPETRAGGALVGAAYGTVVWLASYMGWVPAAGVMPPATRDRPGRPATMLAGHWLYGAVLGALLARR